MDLRRMLFIVVPHSCALPVTIYVYMPTSVRFAVFITLTARNRIMLALLPVCSTFGRFFNFHFFTYLILSPQSVFSTIFLRDLLYLFSSSFIFSRTLLAFSRSCFTASEEYQCLSTVSVMVKMDFRNNLFQNRLFLS